MIDHLQDAHSQAKAQYQKIASRFETIDAARQQLQSLRDLGDFIDQDDVIRAASVLVGKGLTPAGLAGLLSGMPPDGQALAQWVEQTWQSLARHEMTLKPALEQSRANMGAKALQLLAGQHVAQRVDDGQQMMANALASGDQSIIPPQGGMQGDENGPTAPTANPAA